MPHHAYGRQQARSGIRQIIPERASSRPASFHGLRTCRCNNDLNGAPVVNTARRLRALATLCICGRAVQGTAPISDPPAGRSSYGGMWIAVVVETWSGHGALPFYGPSGPWGSLPPRDDPL